MSPFWLKHILSVCPLKIERVEWNDPQLTIGGGDWYFNAIAPCCAYDSEKMLTGSSDEGFETFIKTLTGTQIVGCTTREGFKGDPCFALSDGRRLEFFSTCMLEPWSMRLPKPPILVASPGDPEWMT